MIDIDLHLHWSINEQNIKRKNRLKAPDGERCWLAKLKINTNQMLA